MTACTGEAVRYCADRDWPHYHFTCWQCGSPVCAKFSDCYACEACDCGASGHYQCQGPLDPPGFDPEFAATAHSPAL